MLERLERDNLFVVALDDDRRWYRYHHLFAEFLRGRLKRESPGRVAELNLKASAWNEQNRLLSSAITHALAAPDNDLAARLIEGGVEDAVERGEGTTALRWLEALPSEVKRRRPRLFAEHAVALMITGRPDDVEPLLKEAERAAEVEGEDGRSCWGSPRSSGPGAPACGGRGRSREARPAGPLAPSRQRGVRSQLHRRPPGGCAQGRRRSGSSGRGLRGGRRDRPVRAPRLREARGHGDARRGAGGAGPSAGSGRSVPAGPAATEREGFRAVARRGGRPHRDGRSPLRTRRPGRGGARAGEGRGTGRTHRGRQHPGVGIRHPLADQAGAGTRGQHSRGPARRSASPATPAPICRSPTPRPGWRGCAWRRETLRKLPPSNGSVPRTRTAPRPPRGRWTG